METKSVNSTRHFTVMDTDTQATKVIDSEATTVGQLKADLRAAGFNLEGKTIQEGLTRIEFKSDDAILPHDVPYRGTITNNLVFRLTKSEKKIKSGQMSRPEAYATIKKLNLQEEVRSTYGKNFTTCTTDQLITVIQKATEAKAVSEAKAIPMAPKPAEDNWEADFEETNAPAPATPSEVNSEVPNDALSKLVNILYKHGIITTNIVTEINDTLGLNIPITKKGNIYTSTELNSMFANM